ncbi:hypothetical protein GQR58_007668 [Nymphon striatum]|nr:hypothetical protein GQR58_007668 [Nymphon striatum]
MMILTSKSLFQSLSYISLIKKNCLTLSTIPVVQFSCYSNGVKVLSDNATSGGVYLCSCHAVALDFSLEAELLIKLKLIVNNNPTKRNKGLSINKLIYTDGTGPNWPWRKLIDILI